MESDGQVLERRPGLSGAGTLLVAPGESPATMRLEGPAGRATASPGEGTSDGPDTIARLGCLSEALEDSATALEELRASAMTESGLLGLVEAADFAGRVEELSRSLEYLQVVAAQAVERTRNEARGAQSPADPGRRTGWTDTPGNTPDRAVTRQAGDAALLDDGYRNAAQFLRARLRISISEARRRLALAAEVLPQPGIAGQPLPARREMLADAIGSAQIPSRSATIISTALDKVRHLTDPETVTRMEHALTRTATESDPDFLTKTAQRWTDRIDQDGTEPSEEALHQLQGTFLRRRRRYGLHHLEIFATTEQYETLTTVMNTATNPRHTTQPTSPDLDQRSRAQKLLDGLVGACNLAMTTGKLPTNGGLRPQLTVTINHHDLFDQLTHSNTPTKTTGTGTTTTGTATFTGPIHPNTIRKIACDADIIPVLLGTDSRVLDIGRTTRIFPPHIRKAITARDGGCAFPDCTMPAPWCETHHITYWSHGGTTGTENGTLLCSHHHHLIHKEQWTITNPNGTPWFIPPPHIDPTQTPRRNHHHTPLKT
ncbi:DUF222 domain-containing protein [Paenarthrobacter nitroguajacolicus]|uniref:HNH endonuclease signature motif containing protein n=1 Tax=Paenarthrobacter nitroguajacolicus TaxID=211146 RepID=UPI0028589734|nr:DUF222 domain-containing protein [Paenarthrobacter nitroguajacolicus]MDR6637749.1 hypothetical protein [Paenarthrobacter nitroguajacolicus]